PRRRRRAGAAWQRLLAPRDWPLAVKMALAMVITALLPMALTSAYNLSGSLQAVADGELRYVQQMAHGTAARLAQFVADNRHMARALATDPDFPAFLDAPADSAGPALRDRLVRLAAADPDVQSIMLLDAQGQAVLASDAQLKDRSFSVHHFFQEAMQGRAHTTGIVVGAVAGAAGMFHAEPVRADDGRVLGAMVLGVEGSSLAVILDEVRHDSTLTPLLVDGDGVVIHHPREDLLYRSLVPLSAQRLQAIRADQRFRRDDIASLGETGLAGAVLGATAGGTVSYDSKVTGREEIAGYAPVPGLDWVVAVTEPRATFEAPLNTLYSHLLWSVALAGLLFTGLGLRFARSIVRPIRALTDAADALKAGDFDAAGVRVDSRDEVGQLGRTFNVMIDVLRQRERERHREGSRDPSPERPRA
ncbi:MAG: cache domain-containing protein, partial [Rubrivivax sp.]|nr:cache domain-containing protein [Rubrivivax sp.]